MTNIQELQSTQETTYSRRGIIAAAVATAVGASVAAAMFGKRKAVDAETPSNCNPEMGDVCVPTTDDQGNNVPNTFKPKGEDSVPTTPDTTPEVTDSVPEDTIPSTEVATTTSTTVAETTTTSTSVPAETTTTQGTYVLVEVPTTTVVPPVTAGPTIPEEAPHTN